MGPLGSPSLPGMVTPSARGSYRCYNYSYYHPNPLGLPHFVITRDGWGTRDQKPRQLLGCEARGLSRSKVQRADEQAGPEGPGQSIRKGEGKRHQARSQHKAKARRPMPVGRGKEQLWAQEVVRYLGVAGGSLSTRETRVLGQDVLILERGEGMEEARRGGTR